MIPTADAEVQVWGKGPTVHTLISPGFNIGLSPELLKCPVFASEFCVTRVGRLRSREAHVPILLTCNIFRE